MARPQSATGAGLIKRATRLPLYRGHKKPDIPAKSVGFVRLAAIQQCKCARLPCCIAL